MFILIILGALALIAIGLIVYARWNYGTLDGLGYPVVKPHFLLGSTHDMHRKANHLQDYEWFKKYGPVFGIYEGRAPQVLICDPELVRLIFVKDADHFRERRVINFGDPVMNQSLDFLHPYDKWKTMRAAITPMFSISRVKKTCTIVGNVVDDYVDTLTAEMATQKGGKLGSFDVFGEIFNMCTDVMARSIFSIQVDNRKDPNNFLTKTLSQFFVQAPQGPEIMASLALSFPFLRKFAPIFKPSASASFAELFLKVVQDRKKSGQRRDDLVDQLVDLYDRLETPEFKKLNIDISTIMAQAVAFFMAGPDQYSTSIVALTYYLSQNKEAETRLHDELDAFMKKYDGQLTHENLQELVYTNACIQETLRLIPPFTRPERVCTKDWEHEGIKIKKGMTVMLPLYAASRNPEYFEDPDDFKPERWLPENKAKMHPYAFMTFGFGQRNCIAMRLSLDLMPIVVAKIFHKFQFKFPPGKKLTFRKGSLIMLAFDPPLFPDVAPRAVSVK